MSQNLEKSLPTSLFLQHYRAEDDWHLYDQTAYDIQLRALYDQFVASLREHAHSTKSGFVSDTLGMGLIRVESELNDEELLVREGITSSEQDKMLYAIQAMQLLSLSEHRFDALNFGNDD